MDEWLTSLRTLIAVGLALLLVMLRLEAASFSAAEYDDTKTHSALEREHRVCRV